MANATREVRGIGLTIAELAAAWGLHPNTIRRYVGKGMPCIRKANGKANNIRYDRVSCEAWLADQTLSSATVSRARTVKS